MSESAPYEGWAILELMGHRRLAGYLSEQTIGGAAFVRIDVPGNSTEEERKLHGENWVATQFYAPSAIYCITPTLETLARKLALANVPAPVTRWDLPAVAALPPPSDSGDAFDHINDDDDDDDEDRL